MIGDEEVYKRNNYNPLNTICSSCGRFGASPMKVNTFKSGPYEKDINLNLCSDCKAKRKRVHKHGK